ncbi:hypothetical protein D3C80_756840 [compost metagenome]
MRSTSRYWISVLTPPMESIVSLPSVTVTTAVTSVERKPPPFWLPLIGFAGVHSGMTFTPSRLMM